MPFARRTARRTRTPSVRPAPLARRRSADSGERPSPRLQVVRGRPGRARDGGGAAAATAREQLLARSVVLDGALAPPSLWERSLAVEQTAELLSARGDGAPTPRAIGAQLGLPVEAVLEAIDAVGIGPAGAAALQRASEPKHDRNPERERAILLLRFEQDRTQSEIAEQLGITQLHVARALRRALARLRRAAA